MFQIVSNLTSDDYAFETYLKINDSYTINNASYYGADWYTPEDHGTTHLSIMAPNGDAVSVTSTINRGWVTGSFSKVGYIYLSCVFFNFKSHGVGSSASVKFPLFCQTNFNGNLTDADGSAHWMDIVNGRSYEIIFWNNPVIPKVYFMFF